MSLTSPIPHSGKIPAAPETPKPPSSSAPDSRPIIEARGLVRTYGEKDSRVTALRGVDLTVKPGEFLIVLGRSGSGKSTLLSILGFLDIQDGGNYLLDGRNSAQVGLVKRAELRNKYIGFVFQRFHLLSRYTARENVELPLVYAGMDSDERKRRSTQALETVGIDHRASHWPSELSGGEQQRVAIARALVTRPAILLADEPTGALDTATSEDIISLFKRLNAGGQTIVMVTHDVELARHGHRAIVMRDGRIVDSFSVRRDQISANRPQNAADTDARRPSSTGASALKDSFGSALRVLRANPIRSLFTTLGVVVGIAAIVAMIAIGDGARYQVADQIKSLGTNLLLALPGSTSNDGVQGGFGSQPSLTEADAEAIEQEIGSVELAAPVVSGTVQVVYGNENWATLLGGVVPEYLPARDWHISRGRSLSHEDISSAAKVALLGRSVTKHLFGEADPLGHVIRIGSTPFRVVGELTAKGQNADSGRDQDDVVLIPISTAKLRVLGRSGLDRRTVDFILIKFKDGTIEATETDVANLLRKRHRLGNGTEDDFALQDPAASLEARDDSLRSLTLLLFSVAGVSLVVGGIGIMNIMLVSVTERKSEIALRIAVGGKPFDIRCQFIIEALVLCLLGSIVGITLGSSAAGLIAWLSGWPVFIRGEVLLLAVGLAVLTGCFFGFYPALLASKMQSINRELG